MEQNENTTYNAEAWKNRTMLTLTANNWKRVCKKQYVQLMHEGRYYEIRVEAIDKKKLKTLTQKLKILQAKIDKLSEGA